MLIPPWDDPDRAGQVWEDGGVKVVNVELPPRLPLLFHILLTWTLVSAVLAVKPEVIHFFKPKAYSGLAHLGLWWLRRLGGISARLVVDADDWEQAWNDLLPYSAGQKKLFAWQERWGLCHADTITTASRALEQLVTTAVEGDSARVFYLPNGVTAAQSLPMSIVYRLPSTAGETVRKKWQLGDAPTILLYSRFWEFRLERIVALVQAVAAQLPQARWLMIGQGLQGEEQLLAGQLAGAGLAEYVRFTGWPVEDLPAHFATANVAVYPYDDTLINRTKCSVKLTELLAAGVPVVADAVGQNNEYIRQGQSGILTPAADDAAMAAALVELLQNPAQQRRLGQAARCYLAENFNWLYLAQIAERAYC
jgi:glycosyltransferase involved in cell wall biosynthesis